MDMKVVTAVGLGCLCLFQALPAAGAVQEGELAARYRGGSVSWAEVHLELARRLGARPVGAQALEHIVEREVVRQEARRRGLEVAEREVDEALSRLREQMRRAGRSLQAHLREKGIPQGDFREYVRLSVLHETMARQDLELPPGERPGPHELALWLADFRNRLSVETDSSRLDPGVVARVGGRSLTLRDLGEALARSVPPSERRHTIRQVVAMRKVEEEARAKGVELTREDLEEALEERRREVEADPRFGAATYEQILEAQGLTVQDVRDGPVLRSQVLLERLMDKRHPFAELEALYEERREEFDRRHGPARRVLEILVRGSPEEGPDGPLGRSFEEARDQCKRIAARIRDERSFQAAARTHSENDDLREHGGDMGFLHREHPGVDPELCEAAFQLEPGKVSQPVRSARGWHLLMVTEERQTPRPAILHRIRQELAGELLRRLVEEAEIEYLDT